MSEINRKLLSAVENGKLETVRDLLFKYGIGESEANGYVLLRSSVFAGYLEITKLLLDHGSKANSKRSKIHPTHTPLHCAVGRGDIETVKLLLSYDADFNAVNERGLTPLMCTIAGDKEELFYILLDRGAFVSESCIHLAVQNKNIKIIDKLLQLGVSVNCIDSKQQFTPLVNAARFVNNSSVVEFLLKHGANVNASTTEGSTAMHMASEFGHVETIEVLLRSNAEVDARSKNMLTPLYLAVQNSHSKAAKMLMHHGADINAEFENGQTILNLAVSKGLSGIVKEILKYCPDKNNASNKSALKIAANKLDHSYLEIVQHLIEYGFCVDQSDVQILIPRAIKASYIQIIQHILDRELHLACYKDAYCNFLHIAVERKQFEIVKLFLTNGVNVDATDKLGKRAIYYSVKNSDVVMTGILLSHGASVQKSPELLRVATRNVCKDLVEILLQNKADTEATDEHGRTALHLNSADDSMNFLMGKCTLLMNDENNYETKAEIAKLLLSKGANVDAKTNKKNLTALHIACHQNISNVVEVLLEYKANINCLAEYVSPLMIAAKKGNVSIIKMLIASGACVNLKMNNGYTALHILASTKHTDALKVLLENGAEVCSRNSRGKTPLHIASCYPYSQMISLLLQNMSLGDLNLKDNDGRTPLVLAVNKFQSSIVEMLLDFGSDINIMINGRYTLLDVSENLTPVQTYTEHVEYCEEGGYCVQRCFDTKYIDTQNILKKHLIKLKTAGLYISERNLNSLCFLSGELVDFLSDCECEIKELKHEKIANSKISLYDILTKNIHLLANYARNADMIRYFESDHFKTEFKIYAPFIERNFKNGKRRRLLLEQGKEFFESYLKLPNDCSDHILIYLSDADLKCIINIAQMP